MYRGKRTRKTDEKVSRNDWLDCAKIEKEIKIIIDNKIYNFDVRGFVTYYKNGEAKKMSIIINIDGDSKTLRRDIPGKIEIFSKGHTIEMDKSFLGCFGSCWGLCKKEKYLETTGKMDLKKIDNKFFEFNAHKRYPTINAEITFPCGTIYYLMVSWKKDYEFKVDFFNRSLEGPQHYNLCTTLKAK